MGQPSSEAMASSSVFSSPSLRSRDAGCPLVDYIENHSYKMRTIESKTVDDKPKSDPLLESFENWCMSVRLKKAVAQHLDSMTDLDFMLYESLHESLCPDGLKDSKAETPQPVTGTEEKEAATMLEQTQHPMTGTEKEHCATEAGQSTTLSDERGIQVEEEQNNDIKAEEQQNNDDHVKREWTSQEWKDWMGESIEPRQKWSKEEWKGWLSSQGFKSMREYERVVRKKHRKPSTKWRM